MDKNSGLTPKTYSAYFPALSFLVSSCFFPSLARLDVCSSGYQGKRCRSSRFSSARQIKAQMHSSNSSKDRNISRSCTKIIRIHHLSNPGLYLRPQDGFIIVHALGLHFFPVLLKGREEPTKETSPLGQGMKEDPRSISSITNKNNLCPWKLLGE